MKNNNEKDLQQKEKIQERVRKVDLSGLPRTSKGVDWKKSIGQKVCFKYDKIVGVVLIKDYEPKKRRLQLEYNGEDFSITTNNFNECKIGVMLGKMDRNHSYTIGEIIKTSSGDVEIVKQTRVDLNSRKSSVKAYEYKCLKCGVLNTVTEDNLKKGRGCPVCGKTSRKVVAGVNDLYTTHREFVKFFANEEEAKMYSYSMNKYVLTRCPVCGYERKLSINEMTRRGYSCPICSDGTSFPNLFIMSLIKQLGIYAEFEKRFDWNKRTPYDVYIPSYNLIIENHGEQHYKESFVYAGGRTLEEEKKNDLLKYNNAINNGVEKYIVIDCSKSTMSYIKNSVMNSELPNVLGFKEDDIDWKKCLAHTFSDKIYKVCALWNGGLHSSIDIARRMNLSVNGVLRMLNKGVEVGICTYDKNYAIELGRKKAKNKNLKNNGKKILIMKDGKEVGVFDSIGQIQRESEEKIGEKLYRKYITYVLNGRLQEYKGYKFIVLEKESV